MPIFPEKKVLKNMQTYRDLIKPLTKSIKNADEKLFIVQCLKKATSGSRMNE